MGGSQPRYSPGTPSVRSTCFSVPTMPSPPPPLPPANPACACILVLIRSKGWPRHTQTRKPPYHYCKPPTARQGHSRLVPCRKSYIGYSSPTATLVMPKRVPVPRAMAPSLSQCCRFSWCVITKDTNRLGAQAEYTSVKAEMCTIREHLSHVTNGNSCKRGNTAVWLCSRMRVA